MSSGKQKDRENTAAILKSSTLESSNVNWLRHKVNTQAAFIDSLLVNGATINEMVSAIINHGLDTNKKGVKKMEKRVNNHLRHIKADLNDYKKKGHGIPISNRNGVYKFNP